MNPYTEEERYRDEMIRGQRAEKTCTHCGFIYHTYDGVFKRPYRCTIDLNKRDCEGKCGNYERDAKYCYYPTTSWQTIKDRILIWSFWIVGIIIIWLIAKQC